MAEQVGRDREVGVMDEKLVEICETGQHGDKVQCPTCYETGTLDKIPVDPVAFPDSVFKDLIGEWRCVECWAK